MKVIGDLRTYFRPRLKLYLAAGLACGAAWMGALALTQTPAPGTLRVAYSEFYPYVSEDESGNPTGLAVQVVQEAAARARIQLEWVSVTDVEAALRSGQADLFPLLTITPARQRDLYVSVPWWESSVALLSPEARPIKDLNSTAGKRLVIRDFSFGVNVAQQRLPGAVLLPMRGPLVPQVCSGQADGALVDGRLVVEGLLRQPPACNGHPLYLVPLPDIKLPMGTVAARSARKAADRLYAAIEQLALDGKLTELMNRWFVLPQQPYVEAELARRERLRLLAIFAAALLVVVAGSVWHSRRTLAMRRAAMAAWTHARQAEDRFEAFMSNTPVIACIKDAAGHVCYANRAFATRFGIPAEECYGKTNEDLWPAEVAAAMNRSDRLVLNEGKPVQYVMSIPADNGPCHMLILKFRLHDQGGRPCVGGTAIDITDQQRAAELVQRSEERYRMLFEEAPVAMHEVDANGVVSRVNHAECALLGYRPEQILGRHVSDFVPPAQRAASIASVASKLNGSKRLAPFERTYQQADGRTLMVEVHETHILDHTGAIQGIRTCLIDLTERYEARARLDRYAAELREKNVELGKALSAAQEATKLKSQFLANMSHEIRTPLNGVLGMTELLLGAGLTAEQRELARCVLQSGEHLLSVINDILDVSKIEAGKFELERTPFEFRAVVDAAMELMAPSAHAKQVELTCFVAPGVPDSLIGDAARLRQVLLNLVGNAVKFTARGEVAVHAACERDEGPDVVLRVTVTDTGIGIPDHAKPRLFSAFAQADASTTRKHGGTGLGLTIAQRIVHLMGGDIGMKSVEGKGSSFWFTCGFGRDTAGVRCPYDASLSGVSVLIVDDNPTSCSILEQYARFWRMRPGTAASGTEALGRLRKRALDGSGFQLAIVDSEMPDMDGAALAREIAADATLKATLVVLLTALGRRTPAGTVAAHQPKPVKQRALFECLCGLLRAAHPAHPEPDSQSSRQPAPSCPSGRILVAEDNPVNQRVARLQVQRLGFEVDVVANGEEALAALERLNYALVLMDCQMPGMDGYETTRTLRARENGRRTPVIAMTANAYAADHEACLEAGMDDYLSKPVDLKSLGEKLDRWAGAANLV